MDSYIGTFTRLRAELPASDARQAKIISSMPLRCPERLGSKQSLEANGYFGLFLTVGMSAETENAYCRTSNPPCAFMAWHAQVRSMQYYLKQRLRTGATERFR